VAQIITATHGETCNTVCVDLLMNSNHDHKPNLLNLGQFDPVHWVYRSSYSCDCCCNCICFRQGAPACRHCPWALVKISIR